MVSSQVTDVHRAVTQEDVWLNTSRPLTAEDLKGRIILLDFWTFCCINCIHIMPDLAYLEEKFGDKLTVIGVHSAKFGNERDTENIRQAILRYNIHHAVVNDAAFHIWQSFGVRSWPSLVLINPLGEIETAYSGEGHRAALESDIHALVTEYAGTLNTSPLPYAPEADKTPLSILHFPGKLAYAEDREILFISDSGHNRILGITLDGVVKFTIGNGEAGNKDGGFENASFLQPQGMAYRNGKLYIADTGNHLLRMADLETKTITTVAGTGKQGYERVVVEQEALTTPLASPWDVVFYPDDQHLTIAMAGTHQLWQYDIAAKTVSVLAGNGRESIDDGRYPLNSLSQPSGLAVHNGTLYFVDSETSSLRQYKDGNISTLIGTGLFDFGYAEGRRGDGLMQHPLGVSADNSGVYIADSYNHSLRRYDPATKRLENFAGHGKRGDHNGKLPLAEFNEPNGILNIKGRYYIADTNNHRIRVLDPEQDSVSTLNIALPLTEDAPAFSSELPNTESLEAVEITLGRPVTVTLQLQTGWKINQDAPSYLALFTENGGLITHFSHETLKTQRTLTLPALEAGKTYRFQGIFYYCEAKEGSLCLIKGYDQMLHVVENGGDTLAIHIN